MMGRASKAEQTPKDSGDLHTFLCRREGAKEESKSEDAGESKRRVTDGPSPRRCRKEI